LSRARRSSARERRADVLTPEQRKLCMSRIRGRDTKPEILLRHTLWRMGLRYRIQSRVEGHPDLVFHSARIAVFVDGCQWHCCPDHWVRPKSNTDFWDRKFEKNRTRDVTVNSLLKEQGWKILRFWEHEVEQDCTAVARRIRRAVNSIR